MQLRLPAVAGHAADGLAAGVVGQLHRPPQRCDRLQRAVLPAGAVCIAACHACWHACAACIVAACACCLHACTAGTGCECNVAAGAILNMPRRVPHTPSAAAQRTERQRGGGAAHGAAAGGAGQPRAAARATAAGPGHHVLCAGACDWQGGNVRLADSGSVLQLQGRWHTLQDKLLTSWCFTVLCCTPVQHRSRPPTVQASRPSHKACPSPCACSGACAAV